MIRKFVACAVVVLAPSLAFAADTGKVVTVPADSATHAVSGDVKTDSTVKADVAAKPGKVVHHRVTHKVKSDNTKAGVTTDGKADAKKL
jgi:hypothetical protein